MNKGRLTGTDDLNNVLTSGIYEISAPTTGVLNGKDIQYGILIVFSAGQRIQLLGNGLYGNAYFRTGRDNGRWYDWVSIYWHKIYSKRELGELLGNPKGTKSFSSWSEFTDFVNEMPIKTIQPFVSNFNAFAGEGFYGNVVQGLVIKQLEDNVFLFGIAIDGTLIFRNRNYPDVSTWKDPKIIIHSNNWHKIYSKPDLGELIGTATANKNGLMSKIFVVTDIERGKGLIIDYKADSNGLYTSSSLIEIYVYSGANTAFYRVMSIPTGSKNIEIKYMGMHWCDFKYANSKLYVLPKSDDSSISYKVSLVRRTRPNFSTIDFSDFSNITGEIITPTPD